MNTIKLKKDNNERLVYISDELLDEAKNKFLEQGYEYAILQDNKINQEIQELEQWFKTFYLNQKSQAQMEETLGTEWDGANDGKNQYKTLLDLETEAKKKQIEIRKLKTELRD